MPYSSASEVPDDVPKGKREQFKEVFNEVYSDTQDEGKAMAAAYSAIKKGTTTTTEFLKAQYATDIFTTEAEAMVRSRDMGLDGVIHVHEYDGQAVFMPAQSHEAYLAYYGAETQEPNSMDSTEALRAVVAEILGKKDSTMGDTNFESRGDLSYDQ